MAETARCQLVLALLAVLLLAGCGGAEGERTAPTPAGPGSAAIVPTPGATGATGSTAGRGATRTIPSPGPPRDPFGKTRSKLRDLKLVGRTEADARAALARQDLTLRVTQRDGETLDVTADLNSGRVNVAVKDGRIAQVVKVG